MIFKYHHGLPYTRWPATPPDKQRRATLLGRLQSGSGLLVDQRRQVDQPLATPASAWGNASDTAGVIRQKRGMECR
jgi:hypothetical protein